CLINDTIATALTIEEQIPDRTTQSVVGVIESRGRIGIAALGLYLINAWREYVWIQPELDAVLVEEGVPYISCALSAPVKPVRACSSGKVTVRYPPIRRWRFLPCGGLISRHHAIFGRHGRNDFRLRGRELQVDL